MSKIKKVIQDSLSANPLTAPIMRFLAYLKNDVFGEKVEDIICGKMLPGWQRMSILDVGSGPCRKEKNRRFRGVDITCFDIFAPYLKECRRYGFDTVKGDVRRIDTHFSRKSFDIVWLIDVIEHLTKKEGFILLAHLDQIARKQIIISTPLGWYPQDYECIEAEWLEGEEKSAEKNIHQQHKSAWVEKDFKRRGYESEIFYDYHFDIRSGSRALSKKIEPVHASQMWVVKNFI